MTTDQATFAFTAEQKKTIRGAGGGLFMLMGVLYFIGITQFFAGIELLRSKPPQYIEGGKDILEFAVFFLSARLVRRSAKSLKTLATTDGDDIGKLMAAFDSLGTTFRIWFWALVTFGGAQLLYGLARFAAAHFGVTLPGQ